MQRSSQGHILLLAVVCKGDITIHTPPSSREQIEFRISQGLIDCIIIVQTRASIHLDMLLRTPRPALCVHGHIIQADVSPGIIDPLQAAGGGGGARKPRWSGLRTPGWGLKQWCAQAVMTKAG